MSEDRVAAEIQRAADRICTLILFGDYPRVDVEIERTNLKRRVRELLPDRVELFEMVYESRFRRLWNQWRDEEPMF